MKQMSLVRIPLPSLVWTYKKKKWSSFLLFLYIKESVFVRIQWYNFLLPFNSVRNTPTQLANQRIGLILGPRVLGLGLSWDQESFITYPGTKSFGIGLILGPRVIHYTQASGQTPPWIIRHRRDKPLLG
jgi:hypothetical protein